MNTNESKLGSADDITTAIYTTAIYVVTIGTTLTTITHELPVSVIILPWFDNQ